MPMPPTKSDIDLARKIEYVRLYLGPPIIFLELIVLAFFGRSGSSILCGISRFLVSLPEIYTLGYFTQHMLFMDILPYLKQWLLLVILARRYPELGMQGVVQLCRPDSWCPEMAPEDTEKEMLGEATRVAKVVVSPSSFKYWFFIINGAIYSQELDSPIISGAFQQLLFPRGGRRGAD
ncbi:hypothetical protein C8J56DRAFT_1073226 [Mycena floridula]|nr:hypothetical protein C8J56DRAFT_1073226 [Mycena floridula]